MPPGKRLGELNQLCRGVEVVGPYAYVRLGARQAERVAVDDQAPIIRGEDFVNSRCQGRMVLVVDLSFNQPPQRHGSERRPVRKMGIKQALPFSGHWLPIVFPIPFHVADKPAVSRCDRADKRD
jgi:hypothetical protein